jgi:hypothetical protein
MPAKPLCRRHSSPSRSRKKFFPLPLTPFKAPTGSEQHPSHPSGERGNGGWVSPQDLGSDT